VVSSLLPPNATAQERALELATARLGEVPVPIANLWSADNCPDALLPWLAWAMAVDVWDPFWSTTQKRAAIRNSVAVHRTKGTVAALKTALQGIGWPVQVSEWFMQAGQPYTYEITVYTDGWANEDAIVDRINEIIERTTNVRSWPTITIDKATSGGFYVAGCIVDLNVTYVGN
jgi:phage tail P2-like protein